MFGPKRLPELGRALGHGMRGFKDALSGEEDEVELPASTTAPSPGTAHIAQPLDLQEDPVTAATQAHVATTESVPAASHPADAHPEAPAAAPAPDAPPSPPEQRVARHDGA